MKRIQQHNLLAKNLSMTCIRVHKSKRDTIPKLSSFYVCTGCFTLAAPISVPSRAMEAKLEYLRTFQRISLPRNSSRRFSGPAAAAAPASPPAAILAGGDATAPAAEAAGGGGGAAAEATASGPGPTCRYRRRPSAVRSTPQPRPSTPQPRRRSCSCAGSSRRSRR